MKNLQELRETRGLTQREVATRLGLWPNSVSRIEIGRMEPSLMQCVAMAALYAVPVGEIVVAWLESKSAWADTPKRRGRKRIHPERAARVSKAAREEVAVLK